MTRDFSYLSYLAAEELKTLLLGLDWLEVVHGMTKVGISADKKNKYSIQYRYPQIYSGTGVQVTDIRPDQRKKAIAFFEENGPLRIRYSDEFRKNGEIEFSLGLVVWLNLPAINSAWEYDFTDWCATRVAQKMELHPRLSIENIDLRPETVFAKYTLHEADKQLLMYPYSGFRVDFTVTLPYKGLDCGNVPITTTTQAVTTTTVATTTAAVTTTAAATTTTVATTTSATTTAVPNNVFSYTLPFVLA